MSPMLYLHSWGVCLFVLGFSIESSIHSGSPNLLEFWVFNVICTFISGALDVLILSLESRHSGSGALFKLCIYFLCPGDPLVSQQRLMRLSLWGHSLCIILSCFFFSSSVIYFISYFIPLACIWLQGTMTPSSPILCEGPCSVLSLPAYVSGPQDHIPRRESDWPSWSGTPC